MFRSVVAILLAFVVAIGAGAGSVHLALDASDRFGTIDVGPWSAYPDLGTPDADPYSRARFAREGTLALGQAEGLVFTARQDSEGAVLAPSCRYRIAGDLPPARFWTLHVVDADGQAIRGEGRQARSAALHSQSLLRAETGEAVIVAARRMQPGNWLALPDAAGFALRLTLYDTSVAGGGRIAEVAMPVIERQACDG